MMPPLWPAGCVDPAGFGGTITRWATRWAARA